MKLGGFGVCVHPNVRRREIATKICKVGMKFFQEQNCDIAFLSINLSKPETRKLYRKIGFVDLPRDFSASSQW